MTENTRSPREITCESSGGASASAQNRHEPSGTSAPPPPMYAEPHPAQSRSRAISAKLRVVRSLALRDLRVECRGEGVDRDTSLRRVDPATIHSHGPVGDVVVSDHQHIRHLLELG